MKTIISVPGKVILIGEHSVVYGKPAIVAAIDKRIEIELSIVNDQLSIEGRSEIPVGVGMGSSAALAVCQTVAISEIFNLNLNLEEINSLALELEKEKHQNPSGVDNTICTYGGLLWFRKDTEFLKIFQPLKIDKINQKILDYFLIINTGKPKETTKEMVYLVKKLYNQRRKFTQDILDNQEAQTKKMLAGLINIGCQAENWTQEAISQGERNLERLGVVSESVKRLIRGLEKMGAVAKISGAGGRKNKSGLVLIFTKDKQPIIDFCQKLKLNVFNFRVAEKGLTIKQ